MADHEDGGAVRALPVADGLVVVAEGNGVDARRRFVQHDEVGVAQHGAGKEQALGFAAGEGLQRGVEQAGDVEAGEQFALRRLRDVTQEAARGHRQIGRWMEFLRHEAGFERFSAVDAARRRREVAENEGEQGAFAGAVRADDGEDLVAADGEGDVM